MSWFLKILDTAGVNQAKVDANGSVQATGPSTSTQAGYTKVCGKEGEQLKITAAGYVPVSIESLEFFDTIDGAAINTNLWNQSVLNMTITQANGFINLNPTNVVTGGSYAILSSIQNFYVTSCMPLHVHLDLQSSLWNVPANAVAEYGWMTCATNAAPTDGVFIRNVAGATYLVGSYGGSETLTAFTLPTASATSECVLDIYADKAQLRMDGALVATVTMPTTQPALTNNNRQALTFRVYNTASAPASSPTLKLGQVSVQQRNANFDKPFVDKMVGFGRGAYQNPVTTFAQTTNHTNSTSPTSATLSNTAAGYTTLGGRFQFAAPAGAATDFALFAFLVPAGYQLYVKGVYIDCVNTGAAVATTPTVLDWSIGVNSSAVTLVTADGAGTWASRRVPLGMQSWIVAAGIGAPVECIKRTFGAPLVVDGGRYLHIIVQVPIGTATASQVIRGDVFINGYFE